MHCSAHCIKGALGSKLTKIEKDLKLSETYVHGANNHHEVIFSSHPKETAKIVKVISI